MQFLSAHFALKGETLCGYFAFQFGYLAFGIRVVVHERDDIIAFQAFGMLFADDLHLGDEYIDFDRHYPCELDAVHRNIPGFIERNAHFLHGKSAFQFHGADILPCRNTGAENQACCQYEQREEMPYFLTEIHVNPTK